MNGDISLPVELASFTATTGNGQVQLRWHTESESNNLGFHIYRSQQMADQPERVTFDLIAGAGNSTRSHQYSFTDRQVQNGITYFYWLEDVDFQGRGERHGPLRATPLDPTSIQVAAFDGSSTEQGVRLTWSVSEAVNLAHFNLYRRERSDGNT